MVPRANQGGCTALNHQVGIGDGREGGAVLCAADEDEMGELHPAQTQHPYQYQLGEEAAGASGIHRRARNGPPDRATSQWPLHVDHGPASAPLAPAPTGAEFGTVRARDLEILKKLRQPCRSTPQTRPPTPIKPSIPAPQALAAGLAGLRMGHFVAIQGYRGAAGLKMA